ncbi:FAS1 domain-containing protein SELMODRAFT_448915 [Cryptomeria japonica]|uniref:FAS1 domain-containing protein SELMODRAFT_448915 n=1 Tax=Cryptomeria japonica TaxID=3369 RepID=UPI0027DA513C|nr:FAS1 domain-containing protein SELMODRAFT_448915 [Cryptomeria japonica]XP_059065944.1 FAS1 domain-containing protein SELMODRAFT_448915 [Cryptomeria japonica]
MDMLWLMLLLLFFLQSAPVCSAATKTGVNNGNKMFQERGKGGGSFNQIHNMVEAMIAAGDFSEWGNVMYAMNPDNLPMTATFLVPTDDALDAFSLTSDLTASAVLYHTLPRRFSFLDLQRFHVGTRLPTLLPNATILLTRNDASNFTLDDARITHPDIYVDATCAVHGVASVLNFKRYATQRLRPVKTTVSSTPSIEALTPLPTPLPTSSDAPCLCAEFPLALTAVSVVLALRFLRLPLRWR